MTISRTVFAAVAVSAVAALGFAAAAQADPPLLNGTYTGADGDPANVWTIASNCGVGDCTANIASNQGWTSVAKLVDGRWNFTITKPDGVICTDGHYEPAYISLSIDPVTLGGTITTDSNYGCPGGDITQAPFQLRKVG